MAISVGGQTGQIELTHPITKGDDGGYYIPSIDDAGNLTWAGSEEGMKEVEGANIAGPAGEPGASGVWIGDSEPSAEYDVWIAPSGEESVALVTYDEMVEYVAENAGGGGGGDTDLSGYYTKEETDAAIQEAQPDLSLYATTTYVQTAINENKPDLTPYAKKTDIPDVSSFATETYVNEAIAEIDIPDVSSFVTMTDVEAKGYATETYVDEAIANVPGGGASTAADVSFDDTTAQIGVTNVQDAIDYLSDSELDSEVIQSMIDENLYYNAPESSSASVAEFKNASNIFTTGSDIFKRYRIKNSGIEYIYWDLDDAYYNDCSLKANIIGSFNNYLRVFSTALSYPNLKVTKGHYYRVFISTTYLTADEFYFDARIIFAGSPMWTSNYESDALRAKVILLPQTKIMLLNTNSPYVDTTYPESKELRALGATNYGYMIIEDLTPVVADANEVSY